MSCFDVYSYTHTSHCTPISPRTKIPSEDTAYKHIDQLPPFNLSLLFSNELGYASYQRILGVDFVDDGVVNSAQDMFTERTLVFLAEDFTELMPLSLPSIYQPTQVGIANRTIGKSTPTDVWNDYLVGQAFNA